MAMVSITSFTQNDVSGQYEPEGPLAASVWAGGVQYAGVPDPTVDPPAFRFMFFNLPTGIECVATVILNIIPGPIVDSAEATF